jgi:hypothetical protein
MLTSYNNYANARKMRLLNLNVESEHPKSVVVQAEQGWAEVEARLTNKEYGTKEWILVSQIWANHPTSSPLRGWPKDDRWWPFSLDLYHTIFSL